MILTSRRAFLLLKGFVLAERDHISVRLDRIENKVDSLVDVVVSLAKVEERSSNQHEALQRIGRVVDSHSNRITVLENKSSGMTGSSKALAWAVVFVVSVVAIVVQAMT